MIDRKGKCSDKQKSENLCLLLINITTYFNFLTKLSDVDIHDYKGYKPYH